MLRYRDVLIALNFGALSLTCGTFVSTAIAADAPYVTAAVQSPARPPRLMALDGDRKPADLMTFAGIKPGDKIAELTPQTGYNAYYTQILSKVAGSQGKVYAFIPLRGFPAIQAIHADEKKQREAGKTPAVQSLDALLAIQHTTDYKNVLALYALIAGGPDKYDGDFGLPEQVDAVFTGAGYHELHNKVYGNIYNEPLDMVAVNKAIFRAMKPGAVYVVSDYAAAKGAGLTQTEALNRIEADAVKSEVTAAGFAFDGESNVLMNAGDDLSQPAAGDKSARFVLRFRKPASASPETNRYPLSAMANFFGNTKFAGRTVLFHADGTYQEFGLNDMQLAHWYFDTDGHECMYHESPADQEGYVTCNDYSLELKAQVGDTWTRRGNKASLVKGYVYPTPPPAGQQQQQQQQARPAATQ